MGRPEKPVDRTIPACAKLADFLRHRKAAAEMTYQKMVSNLYASTGVFSKATLERAASGSTVPAWETVQAFIFVTVTVDEILKMRLGDSLDHGKELWIRARRATRAPYYIHKAPDPTLISSRADLSRALRHQHIWAGCPTPGEMERTSGSWALPKSTTRRIIAGDTLPVDPQQAIAFLKACYVEDPVDLEGWLSAAARVLPEIQWSNAHQVLIGQLRSHVAEHSNVDPLDLVAMALTSIYSFKAAA
ncbi:hypothetical protein ACFZDF_33945 [Streptomyces sp. NPDC007910]|uniref:hypothetical protein n=1 Tax=Streptomyces sp. NPDC007910 TaxID=3364790 RepID=UPI0036E32E53